MVSDQRWEMQVNMVCPESCSGVMCSITDVRVPPQSKGTSLSHYGSALLMLAVGEHEWVATSTPMNSFCSRLMGSSMATVSFTSFSDMSRFSFSDLSTRTTSLQYRFASCGRQQQLSEREEVLGKQLRCSAWGERGTVTLLATLASKLLFRTI